MVWCCSSFRLKSSSSSSHSFKLRPTCQRKFWSLNSAWRIFKMKREQRSEESRDVKRVITTTIHHNTSWLWIARQWLCKAVIADRSGIASSRCPWQSVVFLPFGLLPIEVNAVVSNVVVKPAWKFQEISWNLKKMQSLTYFVAWTPFFSTLFSAVFIALQHVAKGDLGAGSDPWCLQIGFAVESKKVIYWGHSCEYQHFLGEMLWFYRA